MVGIDNQLAVDFFDTCRVELEQHVETTTISSEFVLHSVRPADGDIVLFFTRDDQSYPGFFIDFLKESDHNKSSIIPIAVTKECRKPPECISVSQSFDVVEQLRQRGLSESYIKTLAIVLARKVISYIQPTLAKNNMQLFISYRRFDGEEIAGSLFDEFCVRAQQAFRDLNQVLAGEDAQEIIERNLRQCDAVVFLDTPKSGESQWIERELQMALSLHLPIVWVRIGPDQSRTKLTIKPADNPHFSLLRLDPGISQVEPTLVDEIIHKAFQISREFAKNVFDHVQRIRSLNNVSGVVVTELDQSRLSYRIDISRGGFRYYQRPMTHLVEFYGRTPNDQDKEKFESHMTELGYEPHPKLGPIYDAAIMLAPIAPQTHNHLTGGTNLIDSFDEYINSLETYVRSSVKPRQGKRGVIISGAFPDCEPEHQQHVTDAVHAFTQEVFDRGGVVIFGAHPTFQHLIFDMSKMRRPHDCIQAVHLYVSRLFAATEVAIDEFKKHATTNATDNIDNDRAKSLTLMRQQMIADPDAICMIAIGGKTRAGGHSPGVDEEINIAKSIGIPVFLIGSAGGRTSELAEELNRQNWREKPNNATIELNQELMMSLDYHILCNKVYDYLGL